MISAQNRLLQLNGNKLSPWLFSLFLFVACSAQKRSATVVHEQPQTGVVTPAQSPSATLPKDHGSIAKKQTEETPGKQVVFRGEKFQVAHNKVQTPLQIAIILPFCLDKSGRINEQIREIALDYFEGVELALDELSAQYPSLKIEVFDSQNDSNVVKNILQKDFLKQAQLIIGPIFEQEWKPMEQHCALYSIPLISPLRFQPKSSRTAAPVFNMVSPDTMKHFVAAKVLFEQNAKARFVFLNDNSTTNQEAKRAFVRAASQNKVVLQQTNLDGLKNMVDGQNEWIIIAPIKAENTVHHLMNFTAGKKNTQVVGSEDWFDFTIIPFALWEKTRLMFYSNNHVKQEDIEVQLFNEKYKEKFGGIPGKLSYIGFDQAYFFVEALLAFGPNFSEFIEGFTFPAMHNSFRFSPNNVSMYENNYINLLQLVDFELNKTR